MDRTDAEIIAAKKALRKTVLARRRGMEDRQALSCALIERLAGLPEFHRARTILSYVSMPDEVQTETLFARVWDSGKRLVVPYIEANTIQLFRLESMAELASGVFGILEPQAEWRQRPERRPRPEEIDLVTVPGVAFDRRGGRLGMGKGYYDKLLPQLRPDALLVALAFDCQIVDEVPMSPRDVFVHRVMTPTG